MRRGAKQLGLTIAWHFDFVGHGTKLEPERDLVAIDVGGGLCPGIIDQHGLDYATSSSALVTSHAGHAHAHLLDRWIDRFDAQGTPLERTLDFTLRMHLEPDFDCLVASWLVMRLVEDGAFPVFHPALTEYATRVDQGKYPFSRETWEDALQSLHIGYLGLSGLEQEPVRRAIAASLGLPRASPHETCIRIGHALLDDLARRERELRGAGFTRLRSGWDLDPQKLRDRLARGGPSASEAELVRAVVTGWRQVPAVETHLAPLLASDRDRYELDRQARLEAVSSLEVPAEGGGTMVVPAFVAPRQMQSKLNKYWVRGDGLPLFVCVYDLMREGRARDDRRRFVISLDPNFRDPATRKRPCLRGLGAALERRECAVRQRAEGGDLRDPEPRWEGVTNADPWYDGRSHDWGIIDTPRDGSVLSLEQVLEVLQGRFWEETWPADCRRAEYRLCPPAVDPDSDEPPSGEEGGHPGSRDLFIQEEMYPFLQGSSVDAFGTTDTRLPEDWTLAVGDLVPCRLSDLARESPLILGDPTKTSHFLEVFVVRTPAASRSETVARVRGLLPHAERNEHDFDRHTLIGGLTRQVLVVSEETTEETIARSLRRALLIWTYVSWQDAKFSEYAGRIAQIVPASRKTDARKIDVAAAEDLSGDFLRFEARFWQIEVVRPAYARNYHHFLVEQLRLGQQFLEIREEIKRAESLARNELQGRQNLLVSVVGATSTLSAAKAAWPALAGYGRSFRDFLGVYPFAVSLTVLSGMALLSYVLYQVLEYVRPGTKKSVARLRQRIGRVRGGRGRA